MSHNDEIPEIPLDPEAVAREIRLDLSAWHGNCHGVAERVLHTFPIPGTRLVRGHYDNQQHSWLRLPDGRILDPTRWTITDPERPGIYVGENDAYDEASMEMAQRLRPHVGMSLFLSGRPTDDKERAIARIVAAAPEAAVRRLTDVCGGADPRRLADLLDEPVEHLADPEAVYSAAVAAGLGVMIKIDNRIRVLEPERVSPPAASNRIFAPPPADHRTEPEKLFRVFCRFMSIEERGDRIESELAEIGYKLDDLHDALNGMEKWLKFDPDLPHLPRDIRDTLSMVAIETLGRGFGQDLKVERFADSVGLDRDALHLAFRRFGVPAGIDTRWLIGDEARRAEAGTEFDPEAGHDHEYETPGP